MRLTGYAAFVTNDSFSCSLGHWELPCCILCVRCLAPADMHVRCFDISYFYELLPQLGLCSCWILIRSQGFGGFPADSEYLQFAEAYEKGFEDASRAAFTVQKFGVSKQVSDASSTVPLKSNLMHALENNLQRPRGIKQVNNPL